MAKYIDIFTDYGFKKIFGEEANKNFLIDFFNALLPGQAHIKSLTFKNTEKLGPRHVDRKEIYDIYCENEHGEHFIVELQKAKQNYFIERSIYYSTFPITAQAVKGDWDYNLKAVYCIGLLDFKFSDYKNEKETGEVVHIHTLKNQHNKHVYDKLTYIYIEMPNFNKKEDELETRLDQWLFFLKNLETFDVIPKIFRNEGVFQEVLKKAELSKMSDKALASYYADLKIYRDNISKIKTAMNEGIEIGEEKGMKKEKVEIVKKCLKKGIPVSDIADLTGLTEDEIMNVINGL